MKTYLANIAVPTSPFVEVDPALPVPPPVDMEDDQSET